MHSVASKHLNCALDSKHTAKADSGATCHFLMSSHANLLGNVKTLENGQIATLPDKSTIQASHQGSLPFNNLSPKATTALVYPGLTNESLLSIGQFCDDGCFAVFTKMHVYIVKNDKIILQGNRNPTDNLWDINLNKKQHHDRHIPPTFLNHKANYIITKDKSKTELAQYLHATAFSPSISTFVKAIEKGNFVTWPGIAELNFKKLLGTTLATEKGHLDQERKNLRSTINIDQDDDFFPSKSTTK